MTQVSVAYQGPTWTSALSTRERRLYSCYGQIYIYTASFFWRKRGPKGKMNQYQNIWVEPALEKSPAKSPNLRANIVSADLNDSLNSWQMALLLEYISDTDASIAVGKKYFSYASSFTL